MLRKVCVVGLAVAIGCGGSKSAPVSGSRGRLVWLNGRPVPLARVRVTGCAEERTAADGTFSTTCAASPYDVEVRTASTTGVVYQGLTRRDPVVTVPFGSGFDEWVTVAGSVTGHVAGRRGGVAVTPPGGSSALLAELADDGAYTTTASWFHDAESAATVRALEWTESTTGPRVITEYTAFGSAHVTLARGVDPVASPALDPSASGTLTVSADWANPWSFVVRLWATWPEGGVTELVPPTPPGATGGDVRTPEIPGVTFAALVESPGAPPIRSVWRTGLPANGVVDPMVIPTLAAFTAPLAGATVGMTDAYTFNGVPEAVYLVAFESPNGPKRYVVTGATTLRMPELAWAGIATPDPGELVVSVSALGPIASVDAAAGAPLAHLPAHWGRWGSNRIPTGDGFATRSELRVIVP